MSTVSESNPWCAMISAENELGIDSQPFTTASPRAQIALSVFSLTSLSLWRRGLRPPLDSPANTRDAWLPPPPPPPPTRPDRSPAPPRPPRHHAGRAAPPPPPPPPNPRDARPPPPPTPPPTRGTRGSAPLSTPPRSRKLRAAHHPEIAPAA